MTRFYVPLDVNYQTDDKIIAAGPMAECLYVRSLAYAKRIGSEGRIHRTQLRALALGLPGRPERHAATLVDVTLWEPTADGWYIVGWLKHNLTNGQLADQKARIRARSVAGNHKRHHVDKGVFDDDCELCNPAPLWDEKSSRQGRKKLPTEEESNPIQSKSTESSSSSSVSGNGALHDEDDEDDRIVHAIEIHAAWRSRAADDPVAYGRKVTRTDRAKAQPELVACLQRHPTMSAQDLARKVFGMDEVAVSTYDTRRR